MNNKLIYKNINDFYDDYKKIIFLREAYNNFNNENNLNLIIINNFINNYYNSLREKTRNNNNEFKKIINENTLNLLDLEILTLIKLKRIDELTKKEIKLIFENISLFNLKEYDFNIFKKYLFNSKLISNYLINYDKEDFKFKIKIVKIKFSKFDENKFKFYNKYPSYSKFINKEEINYNITKKEINYLLSKQIKINKNEINIFKYNNINEIENDFLFLIEIKKTKYPNELLINKQINKKLFNYVYKIILEKIENSRKELKFINKLKLKSEEIIILLKYYNNKNNYDNSNKIDYEEIKELINFKTEEKIKSRLIKNKYIFIKSFLWLEFIRITKKLISLIENKKYSKEDKEYDKKNFEMGNVRLT